jgi:arginyl-tRNA synthetase
MNIENTLKEYIKQSISNLYQIEVELNTIQISPTPKNFTGDFSILIFPFVRFSKKGPEDTATEIGSYLKANFEMIVDFNCVKGYCNIIISENYWIDFLKHLNSIQNFGKQPDNGKTVVVEYSSPNTNKPLHLGHIRNILLGHASSEILSFAGYNVKKVQIINDRGIHICKSMLAWQKWGNAVTPAQSGVKGDHLVGDYYVLFETKFQEEYKNWQISELGSNIIAEEKAKIDTKKFINQKVLATVQNQDEKDLMVEKMIEDGFNSYLKGDFAKTTYFNKYSILGQEAKEMLQKWEAGDAQVLELWNKMNSWVYSGFDETYKNLGVNFDKLYYESNTYLTGKKIVEESLHSADSIFTKKEDGSVWIDLKDVKLDEKVVLRSDGTSMYITQDMGTAQLRYQDFKMDKMVYVVGNEQEYHFKVLFEILHRLGHHYAKNCYHLSYGMVELPEGKMKSREGTVVDADDLIQELINEVKNASEERATLEGLSETEKTNIWTKVALGALKFYILKVEPKKGMVFDPKQSIDLQGHTGPYIQNAYVRTQSVQRAFQQKNIKIEGIDFSKYQLADIEKELLVEIHQFPALVVKAAEEYNPAEIANYLYTLAKTFHQFWNLVKILDENDLPASVFRLELSKAVANSLNQAGRLIGMNMPERM